jgi:hypothetical protein
MGNRNLSYRLLPSLGGLEIHGFLESPCFPFRVIVHGWECGNVRESSNAVEASGAEVEVTSLFWVGGEDFVALGRERCSDGEECFGVFCAGPVVDIPLPFVSVAFSHAGERITHLDQILEHRLKILEFSIVEWIYRDRALSQRRQVLHSPCSSTISN